MSLLLEEPRVGTASRAVCCLRCGLERLVGEAGTATRVVSPVECPACGYLGWREAGRARPRRRLLLAPA